MDLFTRRDLKLLAAEAGDPCVSLFMPTHRAGAKENPIRCRNLLGQAEEQLARRGMRAADARELLVPARQLLDEPLFWSHQCDGLALFVAPRFFRLYRLPLALTEQVCVGAVQVRPLVPLLTGDGRFFVLTLGQNGVRLLQGTRDTISSVDYLRGVPKNLAEALRTHDRDEPLNFHGRRGDGAWGATFRGQGVGIDDAKDDLLRYFRQVDRGLHAILKEEHAPLVAAGVAYLMPIFREACTYPPTCLNISSRATPTIGATVNCTTGRGPSCSRYSRKTKRPHEASTPS